MKKIKVVHVLHLVGGVEIYVRSVIENCDSSKIEHSIIAGKNNQQYFHKDQVKAKKFETSIERDISILKDIKAIYKTVKILRKEKPDLIHAHSAKGGVIGRIASLFYPVKVLHTPHAYSYLSTDSPLKRNIFLIIEKILKKFNSILVATSQSELIRGIKEVKYQKSNTEIFINSILPIDNDIGTSSLNVELPKNYICTVGRPSYQKNIEMMIEVIKEIKKTVPDIHLVVMGLGVVSPNTENVRQLITLYNLNENTTLLEWVEREEIFKIISDAKLYISTARYEGLPYSIIECLALGKACVVTDCDGNRDLVKDTYNGYLIKNQNTKHMAQKIMDLSRDDEQRKLMESNAKELFFKHFNLNENIQKLIHIYNKYGK